MDLLACWRHFQGNLKIATVWKMIDCSMSNGVFGLKGMDGAWNTLDDLRCFFSNIYSFGLWHCF